MRERGDEIETHFVVNVSRLNLKPLETFHLPIYLFLSAK